MRVRIVCDGGGAYGFGNLKRSATLAENLRDAGHRVFLDAQSAEAKHLLPVTSGADDIGDVWLLDLPYPGDALVRKGRSLGRPVAALDYVGVECPDLIISVFDHGHAPRAAKHLVGLEYAIIRADVFNLSPSMEGHGVMVIIGGGDQSGLAEEAAQRLVGQGHCVTIVDGPLGKISRELPAAVRRHKEPRDLARMMADCRWGVTSGGGTMLEMMCLGKAVHVIPRTPLETSLAQYVLARRAILGIGIDGLEAPGDKVALETASNARSLIDGRGAHRIAAAIQELI